MHHNAYAIKHKAWKFNTCTGPTDLSGEIDIPIFLQTALKVQVILTQRLVN